MSFVLYVLVPPGMLARLLGKVDVFHRRRRSARIAAPKERVDRVEVGQKPDEKDDNSRER